MKISIFVTLILIFISYAYIKVAERFNIIDKPNHRSSHTKNTIRGGGILFFAALFIFYIFNEFQYTYFVIGTFLIAFISFIDDLKTLSSKVRLPFQFIAVFSMLYQVGIGFFPMYLIPLILIVGVGFINIYNFMDGINGITGMYSIAVLIGFYLLNAELNVVDNDLIIYSIISLLVFGYYNFRKKARFFAGDIGSITIAMIILFIGVSLIIETKSPLIIFTVVVYGADTMYTMLYRIFIKEKLSEAHRHHIYQKLVHVLKLPHLTVSLLYALLQLIVNIIIYHTYNSDVTIQYTIIIFFVALFSVLYFTVFRIVEKKSHEI
jgi:UDP-N-acetylmuramyl pentapeptide phosphotransferase/UDP-N-acetylglucosamine-1-phosphate transferase